jgi:hypothetical protein
METDSEITSRNATDRLAAVEAASPVHFPFRTAPIKFPPGQSDKYSRDPREWRWRRPAEASIPHRSTGKLMPGQKGSLFFAFVPIYGHDLFKDCTGTIP